MDIERWRSSAGGPIACQVRAVTGRTAPAAAPPADCGRADMPPAVALPTGPELGLCGVLQGCEGAA